MPKPDRSQILADLVVRLGEPGFADQLMLTLHALCGADMCSGFAIEAGRPRALFAGSIDPRRSAFARIATLRYVQKYWKHDTAAAYTLGRAHRSVKTTRRPSSVIRDIDYRHECYAEGDVVERLSICRSGAVPIVVNAYRDRSGGPFSAAEIDCFEAAAPVLMAAVEKHQQLAGACDGAALVHGVQASRRAAIDDAGLSEREAQVLAAILSGLDQNAIAQAIGVKTSTVVTYRRRGYAKLGVQSRAELRAHAFGQSSSAGNSM
jgi:DNA-binding CsgD family transcriptional regulator